MMTSLNGWGGFLLGHLSDCQGSTRRYVAFLGIDLMKMEEGEEQGASDHNPGMVAAA